jgi:hypothetical protein
LPLKIVSGQPSICIRRDVYEKSGLTRSELDSLFGLTDEEFRAEGSVVVVGPLAADEMIGPIIEYLEKAGLIYFDDFFELSGNWPGWLQIYAG